MKKALETIQIAIGLMFFPLMGIITALHLMGFDSLAEVFRMI